jgi:pimeloyl-ACP methyl ester carboxylesterase
MKRMLTAIAIVASLPLLLVGALWAGQERLIFLPDPRVIAAPPGWERPTIRTEDGLDLAFLARPGPPGAPVVLHFHGNGGNAEDRTGLATLIQRAGYSIVLAEYRGYGGNPGRPAEDAIATDATAILAWTTTRFPTAPVILWGESLGSGVVTRLAENRPNIAAMVLESPFSSIADLARSMYPVVPTDWLLRHRFESLSRLPGVTAPVLVVASEQDRITPPGHALRMVAGARNGTLVMLPGGAHPAVLNDASGEGVRAVLRFLAGVGR